MVRHLSSSRRTALASLAGGSLAIVLTRLDRPAAQPAQTASGGQPEPKLLLRAAVVRETIVEGANEPAELWRFEGLGPAPIFRIKLGEEFRARLVNDTPVPLSLHWQGVRGPNASDGVGGLTQQPVAPGTSYEYRFTPPDPGTFLVRPLVPGSAGVAAGHGLTGLLVVEEKDTPMLDSDHALVVRDWLTAPSGELAPFGAPIEAALGGRLGNRLTVSGAEVPLKIEVAPGSRTRLRLANACNARILRLRFDDLKVSVAAVDSQPSETFEPLKSSLPFPPGTRYDLVVDAQPEPGLIGTVAAAIGQGVPLVQIVTAGTPAPARREPLRGNVLSPNPALPPEIKLQNAVRRDIVIAGGATRSADGQPVFSGNPKAIWTLNGAAGAANSPPLLSAKRGQPVVIGITNTTGFPQPIHLHGHVFRLLHPLDDGWEPYWLDTLQVAEGKTARVAFVANNPGKWLIGSTVLERLDTGLWTWFEVA